jgi:hypothetical protein
MLGIFWVVRYPIWYPCYFGYLPRKPSFLDGAEFKQSMVYPRVWKRKQLQKCLPGVDNKARQPAVSAVETVVKY